MTYGDLRAYSTLRHVLVKYRRRFQDVVSLAATTPSKMADRFSAAELREERGIDRL